MQKLAINSGHAAECMAPKEMKKSLDGLKEEDVWKK